MVLLERWAVSIKLLSKALQKVNYISNFVSRNAAFEKRKIYTQEFGNNLKRRKARTSHVPAPNLGCCQARGTVHCKTLWQAVKEAVKTTHKVFLTILQKSLDRALFSYIFICEVGLVALELLSL